MRALPADSPNALHIVFLAILPRIERHGHVYFRHVKNAGLKEEFIAEMTALAWKWCLRLSQRGRDVTRFPSAIASFAARAVYSGRRLCGQEKGKDVLSPLAQRIRVFTTASLPEASSMHGNALDEALADNTRSPVDEQAAFRIDFPAWVLTYDERRRRLIEDLMLGERTLEAAEKHRLSQGRISQMRRQFMQDWLRFHGESPERPAV